MKIVIDIDEESYEHIKAYSSEEVLPVGWYAIINGTSLPKGHGRLIDEREVASILLKYAHSEEGRRFANFLVSEIKDTPTIIEGSDKE